MCTQNIYKFNFKLNHILKTLFDYSDFIFNNIITCTTIYHEHTYKPIIPEHLIINTILLQVMQIKCKCRITNIIEV